MDGSTDTRSQSVQTGQGFHDLDTSNGYGNVGLVLVCADIARRMRAQGAASPYPLPDVWCPL